MFVVRPSQTAWTAPIIVAPDNTLNSALYEVEDWVFNYAGLDGGWLIADGSPLDAFRGAILLQQKVLINRITRAIFGSLILQLNGPNLNQIYQMHSA